ncbi:MAG: ribonuclease P protein component [Rickettsiales bacterium]|nr:ribonuclease P protein component [Rickettsiales bacterium]
MKIVAIRSRRDFLRVQNRPDVKVRNRSMILLGKTANPGKSEAGGSVDHRTSVRFGFVITKKIDRRATVRNKLRRRIRAILETISLNNCNLYSNYVDYVIVVIENFSSINYSDLFRGVEKLFSEFKIKYDKRIH